MHIYFNKTVFGNSVVIQCLGHCAFTAKDIGLIPGQGTEIPQAEVQSKHKLIKNKIFKNVFIFLNDTKVLEC